MNKDGVVFVDIILVLLTGLVTFVLAIISPPTSLGTAIVIAMMVKTDKSKLYLFALISSIALGSFIASSYQNTDMYFRIGYALAHFPVFYLLLKFNKKWEELKSD